VPRKSSTGTGETSPVCIGKKGRAGASGCFPVKGPRLDPNEGRNLHRRAASCKGFGPQRGDCQRAFAALEGARSGFWPRRHDVRGAYSLLSARVVPHNSSTVVPEGMRRLCRHRLAIYMAQWMDRSTLGATPRWAGRAAKLDRRSGRSRNRPHVFSESWRWHLQTISGYMAIPAPQSPRA